MVFDKNGKNSRSVLILIYKQYFDSLKNIDSTIFQIYMEIFHVTSTWDYLYKHKNWLRKTKM